MSMPFSPENLIRLQRDGEALPDEDFVRLIYGVADGSVSDAQVGAFAMALYLCGISGEELVILTKALRDTGQVLEWDLDGPTMDKASTGGVGDITSLIIAPMLAACGAYVPMVSGASLAHTVGNADKLAAIPGYNITPSVELFQKTVKEAGCAIISQTPDLAPGEKRLYDIRNTTATIESQSLIVSSLLSKRLAAGCKSIVFDVKTGNGAFMSSFGDANKLANKLVNVARACNLNSSAIISDMSQPLCSAIGNGLELREAIQFFTTKQSNERFEKILHTIGKELLLHGDICTKEEEAIEKLQLVLNNGKAAERFAKMVSSLGGPSDLLENPDKHLPPAKVVQPVLAESSGYVHAIDTRALGTTVSHIIRKELDEGFIDHSLGITNLHQVAEKVEAGQELATIHAGDPESWQLAAEAVKEAYTLSNMSIQPNDAILDVIRPSRFG